REARPSAPPSPGPACRRPWLRTRRSSSSPCRGGKNISVSAYWERKNGLAFHIGDDAADQPRLEFETDGTGGTGDCLRQTVAGQRRLQFFERKRTREHVRHEPIAGTR